MERHGPRPDELVIRTFAGAYNILPRSGRRNGNPYMKETQDLQLCVSSYVVNCAPLSTAWELVGRELVVDGQRFDLVWRDPTARIWVEEIKTHVMPMRERAALDEQVARYLPIARERWGDALGGLRVCLAMTPFRSYSLTADGERIDLVR